MLAMGIASGKYISLYNDKGSIFARNIILCNPLLLTSRAIIYASRK